MFESAKTKLLGEKGPDGRRVRARTPSPNAAGTQTPPSGNSQPTAGVKGTLAAQNKDQRNDVDSVRYTLDSFWARDGAAHNAELAKAQKGYHESLEKLAGVLKSLKGPNFMPEVQNYYAVGQAQAPQTPHFSFVSTSLASTRDRQAQSVSTRVGHFMAGLYPAAKLALGLAGTAGSKAGFAPLTITANGLGTVLDLAIKPHEETDKVVETLENLWQDHGDLSALSRLPQRAIPVSVAIRATQLQGALVELLRESIIWLDHNYFSKFFIANAGYGRTDTARKTLIDRREQMRQALVTDLAINDKIDSLRREKKEFLKRLCPDDNFKRHKAQQDRYHDSRVKNTAAWLFEEDGKFDRWLRDDVCVLWCEGIGGAGKSYMVSTIVDYVQNLKSPQNVGVAYFYSEYGQQAFQEPDIAVRVFCRQLLEFSPVACENVVQAYGDEEIDREKLSGVLESISKDFDFVFVIVDSLDEFSPSQQGRHALVSHLLMPMVKSRNIKLLISSRENDYVHEAIQQQLAKHWQLTDHQEPPGQQQVASRVAKINVHASEANLKDMIHKLAHDTHSEVYSTARELVIADTDLEVDLLQRIAERSPVFRLAYLQAKAVLGQWTIYDARIELNNLHHSIEDYYRKTAERINTKDKASRERVLRLLSWILYSKTPVRQSHMSVALQIGDKQRPLADADHWILGSKVLSVVGECEGLVTAQRTSNTKYGNEYPDDSGNFDDSDDDDADDDQPTLAFSHDTVREFLGADQSEQPLPLVKDLVIENSINFLSWSNVDLNELQVMKLENTVLSVSGFDFPNSTFQFLHRALQWGDYVEDILRERQDLPNIVLKFLGRLSMSDETKRAAPLHWCAGNGWQHMCEWLVKNGGDPNAMIFLPDREDTRGFVDLPSRCTSLHIAVWYGRYGAVEALLRCQDLEINALDSLGCPVLVYALFPNRARHFGEILRLILTRKDLDVNAEWRVADDTFDSSDINITVDLGRLSSHYRGMLNIRPTVIQFWPIHLIALRTIIGMEWNSEAMELVRDGNLRVNQATEEGVTALMIITWNDDYASGGEESMKVLLDRTDTDLNAQDCWGRTALMHAILYNTVESKPATLLIDTGAALGLRDENEHTALDIAKEALEGANQHKESLAERWKSIPGFQDELGSANDYGDLRKKYWKLEQDIRRDEDISEAEKRRRIGEVDQKLRLIPEVNTVQTRIQALSESIEALETALATRTDAAVLGL